MGFWCEFLRLVTGAETGARAWLGVGCGCSWCFLWEPGLRRGRGSVLRSRRGSDGEDGLQKALRGRARGADLGVCSSSGLEQGGGLGWKEGQLRASLGLCPRGGKLKVFTQTGSLGCGNSEHWPRPWVSQDSGLGRGVNEGKGDPEYEPLVMGWERKKGSECPVKGGSGSKNRIHCTNDHRWVSTCIWRSTYQDACRGIVGNGIKSEQQKCPLLEGDQGLSEIHTIQWGTLAILKRRRQACRIQWTNTSGNKLHVCFSYIIPRLKGSSCCLPGLSGTQFPSFPCHLHERCWLLEPYTSFLMAPEWLLWL